jgi:mono/diheme cytochrome c family protein
MKVAAVVSLVCAVLVLTVPGSSLAAPPKSSSSAAVQRGEYLVTIGGCNDCHTPWKMGPNGPEQDMTRKLSGHPEAVQVSAASAPLPAPWGIAISPTFTAWSGPWGVSFTANLTPDQETGLGKWTEQNFMEAMRSGKHQGRGRPILPPMPWFNYGKMTDEDLKAVFAYLRTIPAIKNRVPQPILAEGGGAEPAAGGTAPRGPEGAGAAPATSGK